MRPVSFRTALTLRWTAAFGAILALACAVTYVGTRTVLLRDLDTQLETLALTERASMRDSGLHIHDDQQDAPANRTENAKFVQVLDPRGRLQLASRILRGATALLDAAAAGDVAKGHPLFRTLTVDGRMGRLTAIPMRKDGADYALVVGVYLDSLSRTLTRLAWLLFGVSLTGLLATALLGAHLATRALRPIAHVTEQAATIARGHFDARLEEPAVLDEFGRMTALLNEMLDRLRAALAANRRFAADAAHELRSPLTAMLGEIDVTLRRPRTEAEYRESLSFVREQIGQLGGLFENLLLLVRAQEGQPPTTSNVLLAEVLAEEVARTAPFAEAQGVTITSEPMPALTVRADRPLLARAFDNLLRNAVRYNQPGGTVRLSVHLERDPGTASAAGATTTAVIRVQDTGVGMSEADHVRVFERFYRTDQARSRHTGGSGLGLPIAREVLHLFGGTVRIVASSPGVGTTVEVRLPAELR